MDNLLHNVCQDLLHAPCVYHSRQHGVSFMGKDVLPWFVGNHQIQVSIRNLSEAFGICQKLLDHQFISSAELFEKGNLTSKSYLSLNFQTFSPKRRYYLTFRSSSLLGRVPTKWIPFHLSMSFQSLPTFESISSSSSVINSVCDQKETSKAKVFSLLPPHSSHPRPKQGGYCSWLQKKSNCMKRWIKYWFVLDVKVGYFGYYQCVDALFPKVFYALEQLVSCDLVDSKKHPLVFSVKTSLQTTLLLQADSVSMVQEWMGAIRKGTTLNSSLPSSSVKTFENRVTMVPLRKSITAVATPPSRTTTASSVTSSSNAGGQSGKAGNTGNRQHLVSVGSGFASSSTSFARAFAKKINQTINQLQMASRLFQFSLEENIAEVFPNDAELIKFLIVIFQDSQLAIEILEKIVKKSLKGVFEHLSRKTKTTNNNATPLSFTGENKDLYIDTNNNQSQFRRNSATVKSGQSLPSTPLSVSCSKLKSLFNPKRRSLSLPSLPSFPSSGIAGNFEQNAFTCGFSMMTTNPEPKKLLLLSMMKSLTKKRSSIEKHNEDELDDARWLSLTSPSKDHVQDSELSSTLSSEFKDLKAKVDLGTPYLGTHEINILSADSLGEKQITPSRVSLQRIEKNIEKNSSDFLDKDCVRQKQNVTLLRKNKEMADSNPLFDKTQNELPSKLGFSNRACSASSSSLSLSSRSTSQTLPTFSPCMSSSPTNPSAESLAVRGVRSSQLMSIWQPNSEVFHLSSCSSSSSSFSASSSFSISGAINDENQSKGAALFLPLSLALLESFGLAFVSCSLCGNFWYTTIAQEQKEDERKDEKEQKKHKVRQHYCQESIQKPFSVNNKPIVSILPPSLLSFLSHPRKCDQWVAFLGRVLFVETRNWISRPAFFSQLHNNHPTLLRTPNFFHLLWLQNQFYHHHPNLELDSIFSMFSFISYSEIPETPLCLHCRHTTLSTPVDGDRANHVENEDKTTGHAVVQGNKLVSSNNNVRLPAIAESKSNCSSNVELRMALSSSSSSSDDDVVDNISTVRVEVTTVKGKHSLNKVNGNRSEPSCKSPVSQAFQNNNSFGKSRRREARLCGAIALFPENKNEPTHTLDSLTASSSLPLPTVPKLTHHLTNSLNGAPKSRRFSTSCNTSVSDYSTSMDISFNLCNWMCSLDGQCISCLHALRKWNYLITRKTLSILALCPQLVPQHLQLLLGTFPFSKEGLSVFQRTTEEQNQSLSSILSHMGLYSQPILQPHLFSTFLTILGQCSFSTCELLLKEIVGLMTNAHTGRKNCHALLLHSPQVFCRLLDLLNKQSQKSNLLLEEFVTSKLFLYVLHLMGTLLHYMFMYEKELQQQLGSSCNSSLQINASLFAFRRCQLVQNKVSVSSSSSASAFSSSSNNSFLCNSNSEGFSLIGEAKSTTRKPTKGRHHSTLIETVNKPPKVHQCRLSAESTTTCTRSQDKMFTVVDSSSVTSTCTQLYSYSNCLHHCISAVWCDTRMSFNFKSKTIRALLSTLLSRIALLKIDLLASKWTLVDALLTHIKEFIMTTPANYKTGLSSIINNPNHLSLLRDLEFLSLHLGEHESFNKSNPTSPYATTGIKECKTRGEHSSDSVGSLSSDASKEHTCQSSLEIGGFFEPDQELIEKALVLFRTFQLFPHQYKYGKSLESRHSRHASLQMTEEERKGPFHDLAPKQWDTVIRLCDKEYNQLLHLKAWLSLVSSRLTLLNEAMVVQLLRNFSISTNKAKVFSNTS